MAKETVILEYSQLYYHSEFVIARVLILYKYLVLNSYIIFSIISIVNKHRFEYNKSINCVKMSDQCSTSFIY